MSGAARHSSEAELDALQRVADRLAGFDHRVSVEWLDGALAALMAGPSVPADAAQAVAALEPVWGDAWARTFADPEDEAQALAPVDARWRVLRSQLDPEALWDDEGALRLEPVLLWPVGPRSGDGGGDAGDDAMQEDEGSAGEAADDHDFVLGREWASGFLAAAGRDGSWAEFDREDEAGAMLQPLRDLAGATAADPQTVKIDPEDRVDAATAAVQEIRLWWNVNAPRTAPRRAEATPGRNDPCPCGSGRKYKKCHGAG